MVIANAGVMATPFGHTADGFETQFGTNHLGHFVLVNRIASLIRDGGRLINLSSAGHRYSNVDLDDPNFERTPYEPFVAYGRSKTANILFAVAFDKRHRDRGVRAAAVHPGGIQDGTGPLRGARTDGESNRTKSISSWPRRVRDPSNGSPFRREPQPRCGRLWLLRLTKSVDDIARTATWARRCRTTRPSPPSAKAYADMHSMQTTAEALWKKSEEMVGESF